MGEKMSARSAFCFCGCGCVCFERPAYSALSASMNEDSKFLPCAETGMYCDWNEVWLSTP